MVINRIIIDFDDTLFDTLALKDEFREMLARHGVNRGLFDESYQEAKTRNCHGDYDFEAHLLVLEEKCAGFDQKKAASALL